jgi:hypothetical protein
MAIVKYFSDWNGETVELLGLTCMRNDEFRARFPGVKGRAWDGFNRIVGRAALGGELLPAMREITYKSRPSRHVCDVRCMNATGRTMNCECSCGGKNHGRGTAGGDKAQLQLFCAPVARGA